MHRRQALVAGANRICDEPLTTARQSLNAPRTSPSPRRQQSAEGGGRLFCPTHLAAARQGDYRPAFTALLLSGDVGEWLKPVPC